MVSKAQIKSIHSLEIKKFRDEKGVFVAEGSKIVGEMLGKFSLQLLLATQEWADANASVRVDDILSDDELRRTSLLKSPQQVLAVFNKPKASDAGGFPTTELCLALDGVQNPGNLGTIVRLADWFGIGHIYCSLDTADAFSPKAVQASMGALARVELHYVDLVSLCRQLQDLTPIYGTTLGGNNIYEQPLENRGLIVMGNEGNGIRPALMPLISHNLRIPPYAKANGNSESLNVAIATAVVCAEFRRREQAAKAIIP